MVRVGVGIFQGGQPDTVVGITACLTRRYSTTIDIIRGLRVLDRQFPGQADCIRTDQRRLQPPDLHFYGRGSRHRHLVRPGTVDIVGIIGRHRIAVGRPCGHAGVGVPGRRRRRIGRIRHPHDPVILGKVTRFHTTIQIVTHYVVRRRGPTEDNPGAARGRSQVGWRT